MRNKPGMKRLLPLLLGIVVLTSAVVACKLSSENNTTSPPWPMLHHDLQHTGRAASQGPTAPDKQWDFEIGDGGPSSPAIDADGNIYIGSNDQRLYALKPDGNKKWEFVTGGKVQSSPAIADGRVYFGSLDGKLYSVRANGTKEWEFTTGDAVTSSPAITDDGTIYFGSEDTLYALGADGS